MRALSIAATGMNAQQTNLEVIADNIANINTTGFKRARAEFTDLLYQAERALGAPVRGGQANVPEGAYIGLGVRTAAIRNLHQQGSLAQTTNDYDLAINGRGFFQITGPNGETFYSRAGAFNKNDQGVIVTLDGYEVQPTMTVPQDATRITINEAGEVYATIPNQLEPQLLGQITLANFVNEVGLEPMGGNLYKQTESSGDPVTGVPGDPGFGKIHQGYLENSNVDAVKEITQLIAAQRAYEMNSKVIQTVDSMYGTVANNMR
ncbi:flagellar basal-body rod protein FlgG [Hyphomicrobium sp.]|jgi:flagellar basal-body rod protein FlgG|uniref:flagellar basal-body rod protein FlgG n=1 Tax=Hyphomicrobium sp. TaxID=82 RepID=UPI002FE0F522